MNIVRFRSAESMRQQTQNVRSVQYNTIRNSIKKSIEAASNMGKLSYTCRTVPDSNGIPAIIIKELRDAGYHVDEENNIISWGSDDQTEESDEEK